MTANSVVKADVVVVGGGPAGIAAATRAAEAGARVLAIDSGMRPGGQIWRHSDPSTLSGTAREWIDRSRRAGVTWMLQSTVIDGSPASGLAVSSSTGSLIVRARNTVLATGARELFLPYPGWTLPNVTGVGGAQALLKGGLVVRDKRVIVAGTGPLLLAVAAALSDAGARVDHVVEQASLASLMPFALSLIAEPGKLLLAARYRVAVSMHAYHTGSWVVQAAGAGRVESVTLTNGQRQWSEQCDLLCCSYGLVPGIELARLLGCEVRDGKVVVDALQRTTVEGILCAGESTGIAGEDASIVEGEIAGLIAAGTDATGLSSSLLRRRDRGRRFERSLARAFRPRAELLELARADTIVCRCEDVRLGRLDRNWTGRQAKLYTRIGMGSCQGAMCGPAVQHLFGWPAGSTRPPLFAPPLDAWMAATPRATAPPDSTGT